MYEKTTSSCGRRPQRESAGVSLRAGIAKDMLIFIIICSAAIGVAVVTLAVTQFSGGRGGPVKSHWQCLECSHEFSTKAEEFPVPIECHKCSGEAVKLISRKCPECGEKNFIAHVRLTKEGQTQLKALKAEQGDRPIMSMLGPMGLPMELQLWYQQEDGSYTWSEWTPMSHMSQLYRVQVCSKCGASLYERR